ncbi:Alpha-amylase 1 [Pirellulimonas nuda]|uniref:Alpha-amylase 1 n=1 Tax=Pirellulimonas nuda TaxID=2528009 RepID=A0A518D630_9BACT|nr:alpha-amylase/4-alpha-glucanotransferase domain-containing protein [Pirellulimonas nuda]QDU86931.1 Alpha-amylase 1 [Pirellulimonas nuda]
MTPSLRLVLVLHNHQPIGNFDGVCEQSYRDSYLPFLDVFERYEGLPIGLHTSGSLIEWLEARHPEYLDRVRDLVAAGRIEVVGGPFYEPIMTMIPSRDRVGQITRYTRYLEDRLGATVRGMWTPERVWEQSLCGDLVRAGMEYTVLDDFHFKNAGWVDGELDGYFVTEHDGALMSVFPGSERLRYTIPFQEPHETIDYLRMVAERSPGAVVVFGDDGEKLGSWPDTKQHVYDNGWLTRFLDTLRDNADWLQVCTPSQALEAAPPIGKIYIPEGSYREMTEWALPAVQQNVFHDAKHDLEDAHKWDEIARFARGGYWRNFKVRYPETDEMYARMLHVSRRIESMQNDGAEGDLIDAALTELYRGQCNCSYWHGAFGGVYLPHLRNAVYNHLIAADNLLDRHEGRGLDSGHAEWVELDAADYNLDGKKEVRLASNRLSALVAPAAGGVIYELDSRTICHNLLATLDRREEAYHRKVLAGPSDSGGKVASIHDRVVFKQPNLDQMLQYDAYPRKALVDHFYDLGQDLAGVVATTAREQGDFVGGVYETRLRRSPERMQVQMTRDGHADGTPIRITKGITLEAGGSVLEVGYLLEGLPTGRPMHFAVEWNLAGLPTGADDRYFHSGDGQSMGQLGDWLDLHDAHRLHLTDQWLGIDVGLSADRPTSFWTYPIGAVSQSEAGFELVHQQVVVMPHWRLQGDDEGRWAVTLRLAVDTSLAESRMGELVEAEAV